MELDQLYYHAVGAGIVAERHSLEDAEAVLEGIVDMHVGIGYTCLELVLDIRDIRHGLVPPLSKVGRYARVVNVRFGYLEAAFGSDAVVWIEASFMPR